MIINKYSAVICAALLTALALPVSAEERGNPIAGEEFTADNYVRDAYEAANQGVEVVFPYQTNNIYQIYLQEGYITDIRLERGETIKYVGGGDTTRWIIDTSTTGSNFNKVSHVFIKPVQRGISTNIVINTDRRVYQLTLISGSNYNPMVSWLYPVSESEAFSQKKIKEYSTLNAGKLNFEYEISNDKYKWAPAMVFNSDNKTYIKMKPDIVNSELPAFFVLDDENKMTLVSYRYVKGYIVVDRLFDKAVLLLGKKKVKITRSN